MMHLAAVGVISLCCFVGPARAQVSQVQVSPDQLAGRWVSATPALVLDISRCATGWCGVQVNDGTCAQTALRLEVTNQTAKATVLKGTLLLATGSKPYQLTATLVQSEGALSLSMAGNTEGRMMMRTFEFRAVFARTRDASCAVDQKTS